MVNRLLLVGLVAGCVPARAPLAGSSDPTSPDTSSEPDTGTGGAFNPEPSEPEACLEGVYRVLDPMVPRDSAAIVTYGGQCVVILAESDCPDDGEVQYLDHKAGGGWQGRSEGFVHCDGTIGLPPHELRDVAFTLSTATDDDAGSLFVMYDRGDLLGGYRELALLRPLFIP